MSSGTKLGIVLGIIAVFLIVFSVVAFFWFRIRRLNRQRDNPRPIRYRTTSGGSNYNRSSFGSHLSRYDQTILDASGSNFELPTGPAMTYHPADHRRPRVTRAGDVDGHGRRGSLYHPDDYDKPVDQRKEELPAYTHSTTTTTAQSGLPTYVELPPLTRSSPPTTPPLDEPSPDHHAS